MSESLEIPEKNEVPIKRSARMAELMKLSLKEKAAFVPPVGAELRVGPYVYKVKITNVGQLRFSATLHDVIIGGVNDIEPVIVDSRTGKVIGN